MASHTALRVRQLARTLGPMSKMSFSTSQACASPNKVAGTLEVLQSKSLGGRIFTLNRPAAFNALNLNMIRSMIPQLQAWEASDMCNVILLNSNHPKAFCAGGDVKTIVDSIKKGNLEEGIQFMYEEYQLNHLIATTPKPYVAILDGITMGGGVGLSVHAPFRVATEKTLFAMPETAIGLFPDVGGTFFLPRMDGELGTYLALTGARLKGSDLVSARIATHYVPSSRIPALTDRLCELEVSDWSVVNAAIEEFAEAPTKFSLHDQRAVIDKCFKHHSIAQIMEALAEDGSEFAKATLATMKQMSPLSMHCTLAQLRKGKSMDIASAFQFEWNLINNITRHPDFTVGVTSKLVEKSPESPAWPSAQMTPAEMDQFVAKNPKAPLLSLLRPTTYTSYPHRFLAMPSEEDVRRVVRGEEPSVGDYAFESMDQVVEWFGKHWPMRSIVVEGIQELNVMRKNVTAAELPPIEDLEMHVGVGKVGLKDHVRDIVARACTSEPGQGVKWTA